MANNLLSSQPKCFLLFPIPQPRSSPKKINAQQSKHKRTKMVALPSAQFHCPSSPLIQVDCKIKMEGWMSTSEQYLRYSHLRTRHFNVNTKWKWTRSPPAGSLSRVQRYSYLKIQNTKLFTLLSERIKFVKLQD